MKPLSVLIVDDDAMMRISLKSLIAWQEHGYRLIGEASDGEQALEICRRSAPDILITDMKCRGWMALHYCAHCKKRKYRCM